MNLTGKTAGYTNGLAIPTLPLSCISLYITTSYNNGSVTGNSKKGKAAMSTSIRVGIYLRVSTYAQSTENQRHELLQVAKVRHCDVIAGGSTRRMESAALKGVQIVQPSIRFSKRRRSWKIRSHRGLEY